MASFKSPSNPPRRVEEPTLSIHAPNASTTRLPQRAGTPITATTSQLPTSSQSKLQKRREARDETSMGKSATAQRKFVPKSRQGNITPDYPSSALPSKTALQVSSTHLPKLEVPMNTRTTSLISASSTSTVDSPRSNVLRRKQSSVGVSSKGDFRKGSMSSPEGKQSATPIPGSNRDLFSETVLGISLPPSSTVLSHQESEIEVPDHDAYRFDDAGPSGILPFPVPQYALSSTPSTRYSESPGAFSISSTPTSMSSYSPGVALSTKASSKTRQASPLQNKPPIATRHKAIDETSRQNHLLSSVRESSTSSSSASAALPQHTKQNEKPKSKTLPVRPSGLPKQATSSHTKESQAKVQAPPELAHLADSQLDPTPGKRKPSRPSREETPEIVGIRGPSPIIQSNLAGFPSSHKRTTSSDSKTSMFTGGKTRIGMPTKPSRNMSPNPSFASSFVPGSRTPTRGPTPESQSDVENRRSQTLPTPIPVPSSSKPSRFGFFTRRTKTEPVPPKPEKKLQRRGPVAGTGHEGYGRYAHRGRSGGSFSSSSIGRSASAGTTSESLARTPSTRKSSITSTSSTEVDDYFLDRLAPVVIRGTGSSTELSRSPEPMHSSTTSAISPRPSLEDVAKNATQTKVKPTLLPSAMSDPIRVPSPTKRPKPLRKASGSDSESFLPALVSKRTSRASKLIDGSTLSKISTSTTTGSNEDYTSDGKESKWLKSSKNKTAKGVTKPLRKWNFFQRAHSAPRVESPVVEAPVAANRAGPSRSVAHYVPLSQTNIDLDDIEKIMQEADSSTEDASPSFEANHETSSHDHQPKERMRSVLLPPKPVLSPPSTATTRSVSPKVLLHPESQSRPCHPKLGVDTSTSIAASVPPSQQCDLTPVTDLSPSSSPVRPLSPATCDYSSQQSLKQTTSLAHTSSPSVPLSSCVQSRPSRLAQVGRIPQVVSHRSKQQTTPSQSYSRPFVTDYSGKASRTSNPAASVTATSVHTEPYPVLTGISALSQSSAIATMNPSAEVNRQSEFLKFPPRKDSDVSYSSSSGVWSFPPSNGTAVIPAPGAPQSDDEVWNEYDDLIDDVLSPAATHVKSSKATSLQQVPSFERLPQDTKFPRESAESFTPANPSFHLRRSRLLAVLYSAQSSQSPVSLSEYLDDHRKLSVVDPITGRLSFPSTGRASLGSGPYNCSGSNRSSLPASLSTSARQSKATATLETGKNCENGNANRYRDSRLMEIAETEADGLISMANLRFGALMTSKWLSFGRVLFSPAHFELKDLNNDRVLVVDGLGKDWSYYCALTYPEATIYNLGPGTSPSRVTSADSPSEPWSTLRNHRHVNHPSLSNKFPFDKSFFACVVLRFPPALSSSVHRNILSECKRVLRPGGHLELSVLDLDLVNMGNRARRAVRGLKVKMQVADEHISLRNISDEIMAGLGRKGFTECNRCFVGVPVAGQLPAPGDALEANGRKRSGINPFEQSKQVKSEVSFSDLLNEHSSSESTNSGITDMIARVGRWWYSRCYESLVLPEAGERNADNSESLLSSSIWRDESLITECEKRGTSFRLLIGYAQKPEVGMRRTVSV